MVGPYYVTISKASPAVEDIPAYQKSLKKPAWRTWWLFYSAAKAAGLSPLYDAEKLTQDAKAFRELNDIKSLPRTMHSVKVVVFGADNLPLTRKFRRLKKNQPNDSLGVCRIAIQNTKEDLNVFEKTLSELITKMQTEKKNLSNLQKLERILTRSS